VGTDIKNSVVRRDCKGVTKFACQYICKAMNQEYVKMSHIVTCTEKMEN